MAIIATTRPIQLALGQKRQAVTWTLSALPLKADIEPHDWHVRFVPKADSCTAAKSTAIRSPRRRAAGETTALLDRALSLSLD